MLTETTTMNPSTLPAEDNATLAASIAVLGNDGLLSVILSHVDSPTTLVRAALVSKHWLREVSHPTFLRRFRELHPPRLLGFYFSINGRRVCGPHVEFVSLQAPQQRFDAALSAAFRRTGSVAPEARLWNILDVRNGRILFTYFQFQRNHWYLGLADPLRRPGTNAMMTGTMRQRPPTMMMLRSGPEHATYLLLPEEEDDDVTCYQVNAYCTGMEGRGSIPLDRLNSLGRDIFVRVSVLRCGAWGDHCSVRVVVPRQAGHAYFKFLKAVLTGGKVYMLVRAGYIVVVDLAAPGSGCTFELPEGVAVVDEDRKGCNLWLCRGHDGSSIYLVHTEEGRDELSVWLHRGRWVLKDTVSLNQTCGPLVDESKERFDSAYDRVRIVGAGDSAEFVFLVLGCSSIVACLHLGTRRAEKVHECRYLEMCHYIGIRPLMTVWPPTFPAPGVPKPTAASQDGTSAGDRTRPSFCNASKETDMANIPIRGTTQATEAANVTEATQLESI